MRSFIFLENSCIDERFPSKNTSSSLTWNICRKFGSLAMPHGHLERQAIILGLIHHKRNWINALLWIPLVAYATSFLAPLVNWQGVPSLLAKWKHMGCIFGYFPPRCGYCRPFRDSMFLPIRRNDNGALALSCSSMASIN